MSNPSGDIAIRPAAPADAAAVTTIAHRAKASWGYPPEWIARWRAELTIDGDALATHRGWVAEVDGAVAAVCLVVDRGDDWSLEHVWVDPDHQHRGIGRALVRHALSEAAAARPGPCEVISDPQAEPFYVRLGAQAVGALPAPMPGAPDRVLPVLRFAEVGVFIG